MSSRAVSIADLKNNLSSCLGRVREGEELLVWDRNKPIAKIVPLAAAGDLSVEETALVAEGKLRPAEQMLKASFFKLRAPKVARRRLLDALDAERED